MWKAVNNMKFKLPSPTRSEQHRNSVATLLSLSAGPSGDPSSLDGLNEYADERRLIHAIATDNVTETLALMEKLQLKDLTDSTPHTRTQPLFCAVEADSRNVVRNLLSSIADPRDLVDLRDKMGHGLLHHVKSRECAKMLLEHVGDPILQRTWILNEGARVNANYTPLHAMVAAEKPQVLEYFLRFEVEFCCPPSDASGDYLPPIKLAASSGRYGCLQVMLKRLVSSDGDQAMFCSLPECKDAYSSNRRETAIAFWDDLLCISAENGSWKCFDFILKNRPSHFPMQSQSFVDIVRKLEDEDDEKRIKKLLDQAINFSQQGGEIDTNKLIIDYGLLLDKKNGKKGSSTLDESSVVWRLGCNRPNLLMHPLCYSFLCFKWMKLSVFFFVNCGFYFAFLCSLTAFITRESKGLPNVKNYYFLLTLTCLLAARETYQLISRKLQYITNWEDWAEACVVVLSFLHLENGGERFGNYKMHFQILTLILAWAEMGYMFARVPYLGYYFLMYRSVVVNMLRSLLAFSPLLIGFTFGFDILFTAAQTHIYACDKFSWTQTMFIAARMFVMMAGELSYFESLSGLGLDVQKMDSLNSSGNCIDSEALDYNLRQNLFVFHVLFISFILLVTIVMINLLVGLAVSDITRLERKAAINRAQLTASLIYEVEGVFHSNYCVWLPEVLKKITLMKPHLKMGRAATIFLRKGRYGEGGFVELNKEISDMRLMLRKQKFKIAPNFDELFQSPEIVRSTIGMECWRELKRIARKNAGLEE